MTQTQDYLHKIRAFGFRDGTFKDDAGREVSFKQLVIHVEIDGQIEELILSGNNAPKPRLLQSLLRGASTVPGASPEDEAADRFFGNQQ